MKEPLDLWRNNIFFITRNFWTWTLCVYVCVCVLIEFVPNSTIKGSECIENIVDNNRQQKK